MSNRVTPLAYRDFVFSQCCFIKVLASVAITDICIRGGGRRKATCLHLGFSMYYVLKAETYKFSYAKDSSSWVLFCLHVGV